MGNVWTWGVVFLLGIGVGEGIFGVGIVEEIDGEEEIDGIDFFGKEEENRREFVFFWGTLIFC